MFISNASRRFFSKFNRIDVQKRFQQTKPKIKPTNNDVLPIFGNVQHFPEKIALRDSISNYTFANLFISAKELSLEITQKLAGKTNERVLFLCPNDANYVVTLWAIWMSGQIAVPLSPLHPQSILLYYAYDSKANLLITTSKYVDLMHRVSKNTHTQLHVLNDKLRLNASMKIPRSRSDLEGGLATKFYEQSNALIVYTSGTTGNPKGVVLTHKNLHYQVNTLLDAWRWNSDDVILHTLPLHHVHGIVNALLCPLYIGAKTLMLPKFNANAVWSNLLGVNAKPDDRKITVYMAVPTIYSKLIDEYERVFSNDSKMVQYIKQTLKTKVRLMVSGSAPLSLNIYKKWLEITGHRLLERYGMTETGMILSNLYDSNREPGYIGMPLPGVNVRISENDNYLLEIINKNGKMHVRKNINDSTTNENTPIIGELIVKSDGVFKEYFGRPEATKKEFTKDGWFITGDMCQYSFEKNKFKLLGRKSSDIIKSGGYKISALEIETNFLTHDSIKECSVLGISDEKWGQKIAIVLVTEKNIPINLNELKEWAKTKLPQYSIPTIWKFVDEIPKNFMGKINKKELIDNFFKDSTGDGETNEAKK